jgi:hypothetical protein
LQVSDAEQPRDILFENGPPLNLLRRIGLVGDRQFGVIQRAVFVVLIGWLPLVVLSVLQGLALHTDGANSLLQDAGAHARYLLAAPLLILAEVGCGRRLNATLRHFVDAGLIRDGDRKRFDAGVVSSRNLFNSIGAEIVVVALAYFLAATALVSLPTEQVPAWMTPGRVATVYSFAGWWHVLVSLPLLLIVILTWMWRLALWTRLLSLIARLDLHLLASHPDRAAGLGFLAISVRGFLVVAAAFGLIAAGRSANIVLLGGALPTQQFAFNAGMLLIVGALFVAPLFVFTPKLTKAWREGALEYGTLAHRVGSAFEDKWLGGDQGIGQTALEKPDFSATTDLYAITANVYALRLIPIDISSLIMLGSAMLLPFVPVVVLTVPLDVIWTKLKGLLF